MEDVICFSQTTQNNGLDNVAGALLENTYQTSADIIYLNRAPAVIKYASFCAPNVLKANLELGTAKDLVSFESGLRTQAGALYKEHIHPVLRPTKQGEALQCNVDTTNNNEIATSVIVLSYPPFQAPKSSYSKYLKLKATGSTTLVANSWVSVALTFEAGLEGDKNYDVLGAEAWSATGAAFRLKYPNIVSPKGGLGDVKQGGAMGQTALLTYLHKFNDVITFRGDQPPNAEMLAGAGDTAEVITLWLGQH